MGNTGIRVRTVPDNYTDLAKLMQMSMRSQGHSQSQIVFLIMQHLCIYFCRLFCPEGPNPKLSSIPH